MWRLLGKAARTVRFSRGYWITPSKPVLRQSSFRPFSADDEIQLAAVLTSKPRHVTRHIRQTMLHSRKRILQFRNSVTYLMILLQAKLQKKEIEPDVATALIESVMKECVELRQGDMAHLLFRATIRFRKYGLTLRFPMVKHLYDSYVADNAKELMKNLADEFKHDEDLKILASLAYLFCGDTANAKALLREIPRARMSWKDCGAVIEGFGAAGLYEDVVQLTKELIARPPENSRGETSAEMEDVFSKAVIAVRGDPEKLDQMIALALQSKAKLSDEAVAAVVRCRLNQARDSLHVVADVYDVEERVRQELGLAALGAAAEASIIGECTRLLSRGNDKGDDVMLHKVAMLRGVVERAIDEDRADDLDMSYLLALIKGYGVLGRFEEMKQCFEAMKKACVLHDHRLYDEMLKWYAYSYNLKEVIALKEEMTKEGVYHTPYTYHNVFRVLNKYYPRMVEKYLSEMRAKGMSIEPFMYPTLIRVFSELDDRTMVESLYLEAKTTSRSQGMHPSVVIQMLRSYQHDVERCGEIIADAEKNGLLANEAVQAEVVQLYSANERGAQLQQFLDRVPHRSQNIYRVLLRDAAMKRNRDAFHALLAEMRTRGVRLNERLFNVIITGLSYFNDAAGVKRYIHEAVSSDEVHTPLFFSDAAAAFARLGMHAEIDQCWRDLLDSKIVITMPVYNRFLDLYMHMNNMDKVQEILETMMRLVPPNPVTATTVIDMLGKMGRLAEMESVLDEMSKSTNVAPTVVTYHQAMNAYAKCGDVAKMEQMRGRLLAEGFKENAVTYNIMFEGYGRAKRYEQLHELVEERSAKGIAMEEVGYVILLNTYSRAQMKDEIERVVGEMLASKVSMKPRLLGMVAAAFAATGNVAQMEHYVGLLLAHPDCKLRDIESVFMVYARSRDIVKLQEMLDNDALPKSEYIYNTCVGAFAKAGEHAKVAHLLTQMGNLGYTLNRSTSVTLSSLLLKAGKLDLAQSVLKWKGVKPQERVTADGSGFSPSVAEPKDDEVEASDNASSEDDDDGYKELLESQLKELQK